MLPRASVDVPLPVAPAKLSAYPKDGSSTLGLFSRQAEIDDLPDDTGDASDASDPATSVVADDSQVEAAPDTTLLPRAILPSLPVGVPGLPVSRDIVVDGVSPMDVSTSGLSSTPGNLLTQRNGATLKARGGVASTLAAPGVVSNASAAKVRRQSSGNAAISAPRISSMLGTPNGSRDINVDTPFAGGSLSKGYFDPTAMQTQAQRKKRMSTFKSPISTTNLKGNVPAIRGA